MNHNAKVKIYRSAGLTKTTVLSAPLYNKKQPDKVVNARTRRKDHKSEEVRADSLKRSKDKVRDICLLNEFDYFLTLTFNDLILNASDIVAVKKAFDNWKRNMASRHNMRGVFVPEFHSDGNRIHFHGLVSGNFNLLKSGHYDKAGREVFNLDNWKYGFTTAVMLDGTYEMVCNYIAKYITKDSKRVFPHSYSTCGDIVIDPESFTFNTDYDSFVGREYNVKNSPLMVKYRIDHIEELV